MTATPPPRGLPIGTEILTPAGPVAVEALHPGALVLAVGGIGAPFQPVAAIRRCRVPGPAIRIQAGALADGAPQDDLLLPAGHGLLLDGALFAAGDLVDGLGILPEAGPEALEVVEVLLAGHDALLAAGTAVETALPPGAAPFAPRQQPDGTLRALLAWRAEEMGWASPAAPALAAAGGAPREATLRERLADSPLGPVGAAPPPLPRPR